MTNIKRLNSLTEKTSDINYKKARSEIKKYRESLSLMDDNIFREQKKHLNHLYNSYEQLLTLQEIVESQNIIEGEDYLGISEELAEMAILSINNNFFDSFNFNARWIKSIIEEGNKISNSKYPMEVRLLIHEFILYFDNFMPLRTQPQTLLRHLAGNRFSEESFIKKAKEICNNSITNNTETKNKDIINITSKLIRFSKNLDIKNKSNIKSYKESYNILNNLLKRSYNLICLTNTDVAYKFKNIDYDSNYLLFLRDLQNLNSNKLISSFEYIQIMKKLDKKITNSPIEITLEETLTKAHYQKYVK